MLDSFAGIIQLLIPVLGLLLGLVVICGIFIVQPLVKAIARHADSQTGTYGNLPDDGARQTEHRLARLEGMLEQIMEEREFERKLTAGEARAAMYVPSAQDSRGDSEQAVRE